LVDAGRDADGLSGVVGGLEQRPGRLGVALGEAAGDHGQRVSCHGPGRFLAVEVDAADPGGDAVLTEQAVQGQEGDLPAEGSGSLRSAGW